MVKDGPDSRDTRDVCPVLHALAYLALGPVSSPSALCGRPPPRDATGRAGAARAACGVWAVAQGQAACALWHGAIAAVSRPCARAGERGVGPGE